MTFNAGRMTNLVRIESPVRDDRDVIVNWREFATVWMEIRGLAMAETEGGAAFVTHRGWMHWLPGLDPSFRAIWNPDGPIGPIRPNGELAPQERLMELTSVIEDPQRRFIELRMVEQKKLAVA